MADTTISGLATSVTALAAADLFECEQGAASKKVTANLVQAFVSAKGANVASAGTLVLGAGELFHITGTTGITDIDFTDTWDGRRACLIFDGALIITHNATTLQLPGNGNILTAAGDRAWVVVDSGDNIIMIDYIPAMECGEYWIRQAAAWTLANSASEQKLFNSVTNGTLTLPVGVYFFECGAYITAMSATSGNAAFDILGAGGATLVDVLYLSLANEAQAAGVIGAPLYATMIQGQTPAAIATAAITTTLSMHFQGSFEISAAGTIIPSITLATAVATASVAAGSYFTCRRVGGANGVSGGPWT